MIVLPDGKVCRNLPEQVAENLKKIQEIIHFLDGVNIQDNLVVISDLSQILTQAELEVVERPVAFIYYNAELYIKKNEAAGVAYFVNVFSIEDTGTQLNFNSNEMQVNLGTGALTYATATATSYTKSQIDSLLALKANDSEVAKLTGASFTGPITSPSIIEDMSDYSFVKSTTTSTHEYEYVYAGVVKNGNKLTIALAVNFTRLDSIAISQVFGKFNLPASVFDRLNSTLIGGSNYLSIQNVDAWSGENATPVPLRFLAKKSSGTSVNFEVKVGTLNNLTVNTKYYVRCEITFLLSENLAA